MTSTQTRNTTWQVPDLQLPIGQTAGWETRAMLIGTAVGAAMGLAAGWLLVRTARETHNRAPHVSTADAIKLSITAIGLIRAVAGLGDRR